MNPCIAIIDRNTLSANALREMLEDLFGGAEIISYHRIDEFFRDANRHFVMFFISSEILLENAGEFDTLRRETIVTSLGTSPAVSDAGFKVLDVTLDGKSMVKEILSLCETEAPERNTAKGKVERLSVREKAVLSGIVKGKLNKEIADELCISLPTVIFHRNNICMKLGTRSIGKLTMQAVLSGLVSVNEL